MMAWADLAVTSGGSTCWEVAFFGLPACVLVSAENQVASVARLHGERVVQSLGWASDCSVDRLMAALEGLVDDPDRRRDMSERGRSLVDGLGAERAVGIVLDALSLEQHGARG
jgi:UDP-2,4-diacetamido-2,4,6-trideoxy-beta-L-altropyranose hydrolase